MTKETIVTAFVFLLECYSTYTTASEYDKHLLKNCQLEFGIMLFLLDTVRKLNVIVGI